MHTMDFNQRPILVFWETTRACLLACKHCRAEAQPNPAPGELTTSEGMAFVRSLAGFGRPAPVLIMTGGDVLMRPDVFELVTEARRLGIPVGLAPSVTPRLTAESIEHMVSLGVKVASISLDGATPATHEGVRGVEHHFADTLVALQSMVDHGMSVQVNTAVMRDNAEELPGIVRHMKKIGVRIWEVFFLVPVGRGKQDQSLNPEETEAVAHFLYDASGYDLTVRTVEGPFFRRVAAWRNKAGLLPSANPELVAATYHLHPLYLQLTRELREALGDPGPSQAQTTGTRDGKGIIFVGHDGTVYPAGFLPLALGNVREQSLASIYRENPVLKSIRSAEFHGRCGTCEYRDSCGGSRARAYAVYGDPLGEDPACAHLATVGMPG
ncbi:TIGR04053 family radical SAM/SPASM domain-containing protein [Alicyclobacillaceae bacterium I2511]|nr:TIGR04053 family radical SAM/SPASM domain-containing protein [Alicyclobacillaceae bacterium I2511]